MAKDKGKPVAEEDEAVAPKKGKSKLLIIIVALVLLLAGGGGAAWYFMHAKNAANDGEKEAKHEVDPAKPPVFVRLEPSFTVNLISEGEEHMLQTDIELKVADEKATGKIKAHMPEVRNALLLLLSSKSVSALATAEGKQKLSVEIKAKINKELHTKEDDGVSGVYFTTFVIQ